MPNILHIPDRLPDKKTGYRKMGPDSMKAVQTLMKQTRIQNILNATFFLVIA